VAGSASVCDRPLAAIQRPAGEVALAKPHSAIDDFRRFPGLVAACLGMTLSACVPPRITTVFLMRLRVCSLTLIIASAAAYAQSGIEPKSATLPRVQTPSVTSRPSGILSAEEIRAKGVEWHAECMRDWDQQTHMTKQEWARTCQRVVNDRVQYLYDQAKKK
jgi:hypothetical protein